MRRRVSAGTFSVLVGLLGAVAADAEPTPTGPSIADVGMVEHGTPACASCHGFQGQGVRSQNGPRLAGFNADYLLRQLKAFKAGPETGRESQPMRAIARTLTDDQMQMVADYYAGLPAVGAPSVDVHGDSALGAHIAHQGDWAEKIPPCASCHGADGLGVGDLSPPLAGQRADYILRELNRFRTNARRDDPLGLMRGISARLMEPEIKAVAAYYAMLPPAPPTQPSAQGAPRR